MDENESFVRKARCMKSLQVLLLCAAKLISIIMNMSVCLACFHGGFVGIRQMRELRSSETKSRFEINRQAEERWKIAEGYDLITTVAQKNSYRT